MKSLLGIMLCVALAFSCMCASADTVTADTMEKVLVQVKQKLDVPTDLTEFSGNVNTYDSRVNYEFAWTDEKMSSSLNVVCDI